MENKVFTTSEAAEYIGYSAGTLENWRQKGAGPAFIKPAGKVLYNKSDLDQWLSGVPVKYKIAPFHSGQMMEKVIVESTVPLRHGGAHYMDMYMICDDDGLIALVPSIGDAHKIVALLNDVEGQ